MSDCFICDRPLWHQFTIHRITCWACGLSVYEEIEAVNNGRVAIDENGALCHIVEYNHMHVCPYCGQKSNWAKAPCPNGLDGLRLLPMADVAPAFEECALPKGKIEQSHNLPQPGEKRFWGDSTRSEQGPKKRGTPDI